MKILGNILWLIFGGLEAAIGYLTGSLALALTLVGLPWALQTFKLGLLCLWPFGSQVTAGSGSGGCLALLLNVVWLIFGGFFGLPVARRVRTAALSHDYRSAVGPATFQTGGPGTVSLWQGNPPRLLGRGASACPSPNPAAGSISET